jgi:hypothetical protein
MNFIRDYRILGNIKSTHSLQNETNENAQNTTGPLKA